MIFPSHLQQITRHTEVTVGNNPCHYAETYLLVHGNCIPKQYSSVPATVVRCQLHFLLHMCDGQNMVLIPWSSDYVVSLLKAPYRFTQWELTFGQNQYVFIPGNPPDCFFLLCFKKTCFFAILNAKSALERFFPIRTLFYALEVFSLQND